MLKGKADGDEDRNVTLDEVIAYTKARTANYVRRELRAPQTPRQKGYFGGTWILRSLGQPPILTASTGMQLKLISAETFMMGSGRSAKEIADKYEKFDAKEEYYTDEHPQHRVTLTKPFYMGIHEVTRGQFAAFVRDQNYRTEAERDGEGGYGWNEADGKFEGRDPKYDWRNTGFAYTDGHPVVNVSWNDAVAYCEWLSKQEGPTYRLPTEAEWEYARRAGSTTDFHNGDDPEQLARVSNTADGTAKRKHSSWNAISAEDGHVFTAPVGQYRANDFGLCDMHGNVLEWCSDWKGDYSAAAQTDPTGPGSGSSRVLRGGSWHGNATLARSAYRDVSSPDGRDRRIGFRVVSE